MQAVMNPEASHILMAAAARQAYAMGLHRWLEGFGLSQPELEQRRRVFWIMYVLEKKICLCIGRPSAINDDDIGIELPPTDAQGEGGIRIPSLGNKKYHTFRTMCTLAMIESKVYSELYSAKSRARTAADTLPVVGRLDRELQEWKNSIPLEIRPEHEIQCERENRFSVIMLHYVYYNTVTAIHRVSVHHGSWIRDDGDQDTTRSNVPSTASITGSSLNPRVFASYTLCLSAARAMLHLTITFLDAERDPRNSLIWVAMYFPLSSLLTIFAHIIQSPLDPRSESDLKSMEQTLSYLSNSMTTMNRDVSVLVRQAFGELTNVAREHVKKSTAKGVPPNRKRQYEGTKEDDERQEPPGQPAAQGTTQNIGGYGMTSSGLLPAGLPTSTAYSSMGSTANFDPLQFDPTDAFMTTPDLSNIYFSTLMNRGGPLLGGGYYDWETDWDFSTTSS